MKPEGAFIAERTVAMHCDELAARKSAAPDPLRELELLGDTLPALLEKRLAKLCTGAKVSVQVGKPTEQEGDSNQAGAEDPLLESMIAVGRKKAILTASLPTSAVLRFVDLALGGNGWTYKVPEGKLPLSAKLMFGRVQQVLVSVLAASLDLPETTFVQLGDSDVGREAKEVLSSCKRAVLPLQVSLGDDEPWELSFAFPGPSFAAIFEGKDTPDTDGQAGTRLPSVNPARDPFGGVPLLVRAVLVDMPIPVSRLSMLKPGMVLPVSVARSVPLFAGDQVIAHGNVGALDDRAALQITQTSNFKENENAG